MTDTGTHAIRIHHAAFSRWTSLWLAAALGLALAGLSTVQTAGALLAVKRLWALAIAGMAYRVFVTGRISRWRSIFFIILAWAFIVQFKAQLVGLTGRAFVTSETQEVPYCHIAIAASFFTQLYHQYLALISGTWSAYGPLGWGVLWLVITLALGQAWCAWACFYGGLDSTFAALRRRAKVTWNALPRGARELPAAILVAMLLLSLVSLRPVFCLWVCPLKLGTGFLDPHTLTRQLQLVSFATIGILFLVVLPWLTKKRAFCGLICPFGAWQAFFGRLNPYRVRIQPDACVQCQQCVKVCPTFALDEDGLKQHRVSPYCNRCGECLDACPTGAIEYALAWQRGPSAAPGLVRALFLCSAWLIGGSLSLLIVPDALLKLVHAVTPW